MSSGINFAEKKIDPKTLELQKKLTFLRFGALAILALVTVVSVVLFVLIAASPLPNLRQEEESIFTSLNALNSRIQGILFVERQLDHVDVVMASRSEIPTVMNELLQQIPPTLSIISYSATSDQMEFTIEATRLADIEDFLSQITTLSQEEKIFRNVTLENLNISPTQSTYQFRVTMRK